MTQSMPDSDLADLRNMLERSTLVIGRIEGSYTTDVEHVELGTIDIDDVRALVARLDAAEGLIREVANSGVSFDDERLKCVELQIGRDTLAQCRSYLQSTSPASPDRETE